MTFLVSSRLQFSQHNGSHNCSHNRIGSTRLAEWPEDAGCPSDELADSEWLEWLDDEDFGLAKSFTTAPMGLITPSISLKS